MSFSVGDRVYFGRENGEKSLGEVVKVNRKSLKVKLLEQRGVRRDYKIGGEWRVPPSLCTLAEEGRPATRPEAVFCPYKVGDPVWFEGTTINSDRNLVRGPVSGVVTKVNSNGTCEVYGSNFGPNSRTLSLEDMSRASRRSLEKIKGEFSSVYGGLSPENLWCDGEATRSEAKHNAAVLNRALKALSKENGGMLSESQVFGY